MKDRNKTKNQLVKELKELRHRVTELDARENDRMAAQRLNDWEAAEIRMKDSAIESSINAIAFADLMGNLIYVNESFLRMWKCKNEEDVLGEHVSRFWQIPVEAAEVVEALRNRGKWTGELGARRRDGSCFSAQVSSNMVTDDKGMPLCMMGAFVDITERKRMEDELRKYREHLEELVNKRAQRLEREVVERKKIEEALRESIETTKALLNAPSESAILMDLEGTILALNAVAADRLGKNAEDLVGVSVYDILPENLVASRMAKAAEVFRTRKPVRFEDEREGMIFDQTAYPVFNAQGVVERFALFAQDVSERRRAEKELRDSEELFRTIVEVAPSLLVITDEKGRNQYVSPNSEEMTGYTQEKLQGTFKWWVHEDDTQKAGEVFNRAILEGTGGRNFEYKAVSKNGEIWYASSSWESLRDSEGKFKGILVQTIDITERKKIEIEIENSRQRYIDLFELAPDSIITMDLKGVITSCNAAVGRISGYSREEIVGRHFSEIGMFKAQDIPQYQEFINAILNGDNHCQHIEVNLFRKDGTQRIVEAHFGLLKEGDRATGFQVISHDITDRKRADNKV